MRHKHILSFLCSGVLRRIFGPKREERVKGWRRLHNVKLHDLSDSTNIMMMIK
jgi:hypothetical protein